MCYSKLSTTPPPPHTHIQTIQSLLFQWNSCPPLRVRLWRFQQRCGEIPLEPVLRWLVTLPVLKVALPLGAETLHQLGPDHHQRITLRCRNRS